MVDSIMSRNTSKLQKAAALLNDMSNAELETLRALAQRKIDENAGNVEPCHFLNLSAELRNQIYTYNGVAVANKQTSSEYLSILHSKSTVRAKYLDSTRNMKWIEVNVPKLLTAWRFGQRQMLSAQGCWIRQYSCDYAAAEESVIHHTRLDDERLDQGWDPAGCTFFGILELPRVDGGCFTFDIKGAGLQYCREAGHFQEDSDEEEVESDDSDEEVRPRKDSDGEEGLSEESDEEI
ncbi:hypothetical protein CBER1_11552 [Cercospora berteroae]|uniref:Uncharacterized protein n=1 Tax=Cercospora berteroae TaxID=357750 RepID=A0A2S6C0A6_9PEZI|nr:hypothetical protein CBER1_11552 [Cercospora berteroae]